MIFRDILRIAADEVLLLTSARSLRGVPHPLVIGATGGSGTRVIAQIAQKAGWFMGSQLNHARDSKDTGAPIRRWLPRYLESGSRLAADQKRRMDRDFNAALIRHRKGIQNPQTSWGFKNPRSQLLLPYFYSRFEQLRFIHLVRDGRDMAFASNQVQLRQYGSYFLDPYLNKAPLPQKLIRFWAVTNLQVQQFGREKLDGRYLCVRFEDLCREPIPTVKRVFKFLDADPTRAKAAATLVHPPSSLGRWKQQPKEARSGLVEAAEEALARFGYVHPG